MLNPDFWLDEEVAKLSAHARLLYMGLWGICDDNYATFPNRPDWIKAQVFPYEIVDVKVLLKELEDIKKIIIFTADDGKEYWFIKNFFKHQVLNRPSKPKYPKFTDYSRNTHGALTLKRKEEKRKERKGKEYEGRETTVNF